MSKAEKDDKVDMFDLIKKADLKQYNYFQEQYLPTQRKKLSHWLMMRYMASSNGKNDARNLLFTNSIVNKDFNVIYKNHPDLIYKLFCIVGTGQTEFHKYIAPPKGQRLVESLAMKFFSELFNQSYTDREIELMCKKHKNDEEMVREFAKDLYWDSKDIEKLVLEINSIIG